jgi:hypothetical protein
MPGVNMVDMVMGGARHVPTNLWTLLYILSNAWARPTTLSISSLVVHHSHAGWTPNIEALRGLVLTILARMYVLNPIQMLRIVQMLKFKSNLKVYGNLSWAVR